MYTLRTIIEGDNGESFNRSLGPDYSKVGRFEHPNRFREIFKKHFNRSHAADLSATADTDTERTICFIISSDGTTIPIYQGMVSYIMTDRGTTFERLNRPLPKHPTTTD